MRSELAAAPVGRGRAVVLPSVVVRDLGVLSVREGPHALVRLRLGQLRGSRRARSAGVGGRGGERRASLLVVAKSGHSTGSNSTVEMLWTCRERGGESAKEARPGRGEGENERTHHLLDVGQALRAVKLAAHLEDLEACVRDDVRLVLGDVRLEAVERCGARPLGDGLVEVLSVVDLACERRRVERVVCRVEPTERKEEVAIDAEAELGRLRVDDGEAQELVGRPL